MTSPVAVTIRLMAGDDLDTVRVIEDAAYGTEAWTCRTFEDELVNGFSSYVVAELSNGQLAGFAGVWFMRDQLHIVTVAVDPQLQRLGIASRLLRAASKWGWRQRCRSQYWRSGSRTLES
jgi:ribosomal-protein-alanine N-acetyltransferase